MKTDAGNKIVVLDLNKEECDSLEEEGILEYFDYLDEDELLLSNSTPSKLTEAENNYEIDSKFYMDADINREMMLKIMDLKEVPCIPDVLIDAIENPIDSDFEFDPLFKYDIIKKFISNREVTDKEKCDASFRLQVQYLKSLDVFPEYVNECFEDAVQTFEILDLEDIKELRKIDSN